MTLCNSDLMGTHICDSQVYPHTLQTPTHIHIIKNKKIEMCCDTRFSFNVSDLKISIQDDRCIN